MIPLTFPYYSVRDRVTPSKTVSYEFHSNHEYNSSRVLSISRSAQSNHPPAYNKYSILTITKEQWPMFCSWIRGEVINEGKEESIPLHFSISEGSVEFIFNRHESYQGSNFVCLHKKDALHGRTKYQNLAIAKDQWSEFRKWMEQVIEEKPGF
jgi:hypothetical protein